MADLLQAFSASVSRHDHVRTVAAAVLVLGMRLGRTPRLAGAWRSLGRRPTESATGRTAPAQHPIMSQTQLQHQRGEAWRTNLWASSCGVPNEGTDRYHRNPRHSRALGARVPTGPGTMIAQPPESRECNQTHGSSHHDENTVPAFNRLGSVAQPLLNRRCSTLPRTEG